MEKTKVWSEGEEEEVDFRVGEMGEKKKKKNDLLLLSPPIPFRCVCFCIECVSGVCDRESHGVNVFFYLYG